ncbi:MYG1 family protein [Flammeovirga pacifica]|uniref:Metal-dependent hydrolase n=1 Tax=Flammeovirga pacifica TaxID=915059 RepID=A0A1S1YT67_FLAPC|nr:MYG1 family protein [Flammeovirga pacifica]OHX64053.1 hypothetical protein NH26_20810 [Flammeovirga pacifica]
MKPIFEKIITHSGNFHADEILAIILLKQFKFINDKTIIERRIPTILELNDTCICCLDVGLSYSPSCGNFDHHHNNQLAATCQLVWRYLHAHHQIDDWEYKNAPLAAFIKKVSQIDTGVIANGGELGFFNSFIKQFNGTKNGFNKALKWGEQTWELMWWNHTQLKLERKQFRQLKTDTKVIVYQDHKFKNWHYLANELGIEFLISPLNKEQWIIRSVHPQKYPLPIRSDYIFRHNSGFMAIIASKRKALEIVKEILELCS